MAFTRTTISKEKQKSSSPTTKTDFRDTAWDERLDYLREHRLSPAVEVVVAWVVAMLCLAYYAYSYLSLCFFSSLSAADDAKNAFFPLATQAKGQVENRSVATLYQAILEKLNQCRTNDEDSSSITSALTDVDDDKLVQCIRTDLDLRRLVSSLFQQDTQQVSLVLPRKEMERFKRLWPRCLELPTLPHQPITPGIALILPAFREDGLRIVRTLRIALEHCHDASRVQVIVVHAGQCTHMDAVQSFLQQCKELHPSWRIVNYTAGGGRGPTLHYGTTFVHDTDNIQLLTFLHSDTLLPRHWDATVRRAWFDTNNNDNAIITKRKLQAAAFLFGQDKSVEGLNGGPYPWGIEAVQVLGNIRAYVASLPYGDHVLSMPTAYYRHIGGFPNQPIMEDYQLMDYWRQRARVVDNEYMTILPSMIRTGVRRWQAHGVVYVTLVNGLIVYRYQRGWTPQDVFEYYYQRPRQKKENIKND